MTDRFDDLLTKIDKIWSKDDRCKDWISTIWLIQKQLDEIEEKKFEANTVLNEFADILIITCRYIHNIGIDPIKLMAYRLDTRHKDKTDEIKAKYDKMFREERFRVDTK